MEDIADQTGVTFDIYNLAAFNYDPVHTPSEDVEAHLRMLAARDAQLLIRK